jgi:hypothetical protein
MPLIPSDFRYGRSAADRVKTTFAIWLRQSNGVSGCLVLQAESLARRTFTSIWADTVRSGALQAGFSSRCRFNVEPVFDALYGTRKFTIRDPGGNAWGFERGWSSNDRYVLRSTYCSCGLLGAGLRAGIRGNSLSQDCWKSR